MTDKPRFILELNLINIGTKISVAGPTLISDKLVNEAWIMLGSFLEHAMDTQKLEMDDEDSRELLIELLYRLIYREMTTLRLLPIWEQNLGLIPETRPLFIEAEKKRENTDGR